MNRPTAVRWRILAILALASFIAYVLRTNLSFAAPAMMADLGMDEIRWGYVLAAFTAGYAIFQFPGGVLGDRFGPRRVLTAIAVLWTVLTLATVLVPGRPDGESSGGAMLVVGSLVIMRFLVGAVHAPMFPVMNTSVVRWFPVGGWARCPSADHRAVRLAFCLHDHCAAGRAGRRSLVVVLARQSGRSRRGE
jgi:ACS family glucarate transporter-like MFS transporter